MKNDGITPIYEKCSVYVGLLDQNNKLVQKYKTNIDPKEWEPGTVTSKKALITFSNVSSGNYKLAIGLYKNDEDERPTYLLGSEGKTTDNWYVVGDIKLVGANGEIENNNEFKKVESTSEFWKFDKSTKIIEQYIGKDAKTITKLTIPNYIDGIEVKGIANCSTNIVEYDNPNLAEVEISDGIISIRKKCIWKM